MLFLFKQHFLHFHEFTILFIQHFHQHIILMMQVVKIVQLPSNILILNLLLVQCLLILLNLLLQLLIFLF